MRCLLGLACCVTLAAGDLVQLRQLLEKNRIFELREALGKPGWNDSAASFYRAVVEARFGNESGAIENLRKSTASNAGTDLERRAFEELASALVRLSRYGDAAHAWAESLRLTPRQDKDRADIENTRALYQSLSDVAPQAIRFGQEVPLQAKQNGLGSWDVPVEVNGHEGEWIFDTGANVSTVSESEAYRMGLVIRQSNAYVKGSTDKKNSLHLAVARDLRFGSAHLSNVIFLVLPDESLYIGPVKFQIRGILGLPVIRALGTVGISAKGAVHLEAKETGAAGAPNLFFDELDPIIDTHHAGHRLQMFLDSGANTTVLYPSFRASLTKDEISKLKTKREKRGGAGGIVSQSTNVAPALRLEILGRAVDLANVSLFLKQPAGTRRHWDGVLGMDSLAGGFTLDFRRMQLRLD